MNFEMTQQSLNGMELKVPTIQPILSHLTKVKICAYDTFVEPRILNQSTRWTLWLEREKIKTKQKLKSINFFNNNNQGFHIRLINSHHVTMTRGIHSIVKLNTTCDKKKSTFYIKDHQNRSKIFHFFFTSRYTYYL